MGATLASTLESLLPTLLSTLESLLPALVNGSWTLPIRLETSSWTCSERLVRKPPRSSEPACQKTLSSAYSDVQLLGKRVSYLDAACRDCLRPIVCLIVWFAAASVVVTWRLRASKVHHARGRCTACPSRGPYP